MANTPPPAPVRPVNGPILTHVNTPLPLQSSPDILHSMDEGQAPMAWRSVSKPSQGKDSLSGGTRLDARIAPKRKREEVSPVFDDEGPTTTESPEPTNSKQRVKKAEARGRFAAAQIETRILEGHDALNKYASHQSDTSELPPLPKRKEETIKAHFPTTKRRALHKEKGREKSVPILNKDEASLVQNRPPPRTPDINKNRPFGVYSTPPNLPASNANLSSVPNKRNQHTMRNTREGLEMNERSRTPTMFAQWKKDNRSSLSHNKLARRYEGDGGLHHQPKNHTDVDSLSETFRSPSSIDTQLASKATLTSGECPDLLNRFKKSREGPGAGIARKLVIEATVGVSKNHRDYPPGTGLKASVGLQSMEQLQTERMPPQTTEISPESSKPPLLTSRSGYSAPDVIPLGLYSGQEMARSELYATLPVPDPACLPDVTPIDPGPELCEEQHNLVELIKSGRNVFYTGSAGCGKSTVLKNFVRQLRQRGLIVDVVAPTGIAALNVGGCTIYTYAGWTPDSLRRDTGKLMNDAYFEKLVQERLAKTHVLVIDEISMVENHFFERLNRVLKSARRDRDDGHLPFGGVQLVVTGDFCQLPPVLPFQFCMRCGTQNKRTVGNQYTCPDHGTFHDFDKWAFLSDAWEECEFLHINLVEVHRQTDRTFVSILEKLRLGKLLTEDEKAFFRRPKVDKSSNIRAVRLYPTNKAVDLVNDREFRNLKAEEGELLTFTSKDLFLRRDEQFDGPDYSQELKDHRFGSTLRLKKGMPVLLLVNISVARGLVNGSMGEVVGFMKHDQQALPEQKGEYGGIRQVEIEDFIRKVKAKEPKWPVVRFRNGRELPIYPHCMVNEVGDQEPFNLLGRTQIPLVAAWAITIHRSQGMTLDHMFVDLTDCHAQGQMYVALSRAKDPEALEVNGLDKIKAERNKIGANHEVKEFLKTNFGIE